MLYSITWADHYSKQLLAQAQSGDKKQTNKKILANIVQFGITLHKKREDAWGLNEK